LRYDWVYRLKADFPYIDIVINGGIATVDQIKTHLQRVDGVMLGRAAYANPWLLSQANELFARQPVSPPAVFAKLLLYAQQELEQGTRSAAIFRHWLHLFSGFPGAKQIRQKFSSANPEEVLTLLATLKAGEYP
jgi:tRNA-dihydrouridine synthase A